VGTRKHHTTLIYSPGSKQGQHPAYHRVLPFFLDNIDYSHDSRSELEVDIRGKHLKTSLLGNGVWTNKPRATSGMDSRTSLIQQ